MDDVKHNEGDKIFMKVLGVKANDVRNWTPPPKLCQKYLDVETEQSVDFVPSRKPDLSTEEMVGKRTEKGYLVSVNDELIALFKVQGKLYALKDSCPHAGGPLSMGDIEELPGEGVCVRCPWHQWKILLENGNVGGHQGRSECAVVYPVKVNKDGEIYIGFSQVSQNFFNIDKHPSGDKDDKGPWLFTS